jgi:putative peptide zinc metalloprotease protein
MSTLALRWVTLLVIAIACALPAGSAQAAPSTENAATAVIEQDEGRAFDVAWDLSRRRGDDEVTDSNSATAEARCVRCRATAIAFQIVIVSGSPGTVVPRNTAQAINVECTECVVVAEARQFVRVVPDPVRLTGAGRAELADVRADLEALEAQDPPIDQLHQAIESQEARVLHVLRDELVLKSGADKEPDVLERRSLQAVDLG